LGEIHTIVKSSHLNTFVVFFVLLLFCLLFPFFTGYTKTFIVLSGSMLPMMTPGDMIFTNTINPEDLKVGDVIAFKDPQGTPNTIVTHRIISIDDSSGTRIFQTKGEANGSPDAFSVPESSIIGKLAFVLPLVGYLPGFLKNNPIVYVLIIIVPALLLIYNEIQTIADYSNFIRARKIEKLNRKTTKKTLHVIKEHKLAEIMLIGCIISSGLVIPAAKVNDQTIIEKDSTIYNSGHFPIVYISTSNDYTKHWYGTAMPTNKTLIEKSENTNDKIISVPYILPVYWLLVMTKTNPYLPIIAEICLYTLLIILITVPIWYQKTIVGKRSKKIRTLGGSTWKIYQH
jgi:signal peptidase I